MICGACAPVNRLSAQSTTSKELELNECPVAEVDDAWPCNRFYRLVAALIDSMIIEFIFAFLVLLFDRGDWAATASIALSGDARILAGAFSFFYYLSFEGLIFATPGKVLLGMSVRNQSGGPPSLLQISGRYFGRLLFLLLVIPTVIFLFVGQLRPAMMFMVLSVVVCFLSNVMYLFTQEHQALHDILSRCVIKQAVDISVLRAVLAILILVASIASYLYIFRDGIKAQIILRQKYRDAYHMEWNSRR